MIPKLDGFFLLHTVKREKTDFLFSFSHKFFLLSLFPLFFDKIHGNYRFFFFVNFFPPTVCAPCAIFFLPPFFRLKMTRNVIREREWMKNKKSEKIILVGTPWWNGFQLFSSSSSLFIFNIALMLIMLVNNASTIIAVNIKKSFKLHRVDFFTSLKN